MGLARSARAERNDVFATLGPFTTRQFHHLHLVDLGDGGEVKTAQAFEDREFGCLGTAFDLVAIPFDPLRFGKTRGGRRSRRGNQSPLLRPRTPSILIALRDSQECRRSF